MAKATKDEDYNDDVDEFIDPKSTMIGRKTFETNQNNLNEIYINTSQANKFYTCPNDDISLKKEYQNYYSSYMPIPDMNNQQITNSQFPKISDKKEEIE